MAIGLALLSPIDTLSGDLLTVHMAQHLLLTIVAPPLIAAAGIGTLILRAADPNSRRGFVLPILHSRVVAGLTHPVVGAVAFAAVMWGSHFSGLYNLALLDDRVHALEHGLYFGASLLFWWPLFSPDPSRWRLHPAARLLLVAIEMPQMSFLAMALLNAPAPLYPAYLGRPDVFGIDALTDQRIAGSLMWLTGDLGLLSAAGVLLWRLFRHEEEQTRRIDARLDRARRTPASSPARTED
jgi:cytochrome c oxidase assembly factor CtaG